MRILITGAAGFLGSHLMRHLRASGHDVVGIDDLSRAWSGKRRQDLHREGFDVVRGDIRDRSLIAQILVAQEVEGIFHFAGQTAVTTSIADPQADFETNVVGTFNVLEAARQSTSRPFIVFSSSNKVYGAHTDKRSDETAEAEVSDDPTTNDPTINKTDISDPVFLGWLAGLIDGEGHFAIHENTTPNGLQRYDCTFSLTLRADDSEILNSLHQRTGLGRVYTRPQVRGSKPRVDWRIMRLEHCLKLIAILDRFPLRTRKTRDYRIWRTAALRIAKMPQRNVWKPRDWSPIAALKRDIESTRNYWPLTDESAPIVPMTPYGVSKTVADQYAADWYRTYDLRTAVLRMSCVYGPGQFGTEDQGWVGHMAISTALGKPITVYGNGKQVRDVLFVDDYVRLCGMFADAAQVIDAEKETIWGEVYNVGGGPDNTLSILELLDLLKREHGLETQIQFGPWRPSDQRVYVSDITKVREIFGWRPLVGPAEGVRQLVAWVTANSP